MFSLSALGLLYLYVVRRSSMLHNAVVVASILPIAFAANIVRVLALILVTYHFGDEAGQGFLHGAAGMVLVMAALLLLLLFDGMLAKLTKSRPA
jgi:exosortase/archaeosortase family protein